MLNKRKEKKRKHNAVHMKNTIKEKYTKKSFGIYKYNDFLTFKKSNENEKGQCQFSQYFSLLLIIK